MADIRSKSDEVVLLSRELLEDIELSRLSAEGLILKATRLARLVDADPSFRSFLGWEMRGYPANDKLAGDWMAYVGRWINRQRGQAYWGPLAQIESAIQATSLRLATLRVPDINVTESLHSANPNQYLQPRGYLEPSPGKAVRDTISAVTQEASARQPQSVSSAAYVAAFSQLFISLPPTSITRKLSADSPKAYSAHIRLGLTR